MTEIKVMSWNVGSLHRYIRGFDTEREPNDAHLLKYIAQVIIESKANIVSLIEVSFKYQKAMIEGIVGHLQQVDDFWWYALSEKINSNDECYAILYNMREGFDLREDPNGEGGKGEANKTKTNHWLEFTGPQGLEGGRPPWWFAFKTKDKKNFVIVTFHNSASGGRTFPERKDQRENIEKLANLKIYEELPPLPENTVDGFKVKPRKNPPRENLEVELAILTGDFNVNYSPKQWKGNIKNPYVELETNSGFWSIFKNISPPSTLLENKLEDPNDSYFVPERCIDNIFVPMLSHCDGEILDIVKLSAYDPNKDKDNQTELYKLFSKLFQPPLQAVNPSEDPDYFVYINGDETRYADNNAWACVRGAISDHVPVVMDTITI